MGAWANFFAAEVSASAALTGLIFVAVSINLTKILAYRNLPTRALEALVALISVLIVSSLALTPGQSLTVFGVELALLGLVYLLTTSTLQFRSLRAIEAKYRRSASLSVVIGQLAALSFAAAGAVVLLVGGVGLYLLEAGIALSFLFAFLDAWVLLVEINR